LVFALFALLVVNSVYLVVITVAGVQFQNYFYQWMFLLHLLLGLAIVLPVVLFGAFHIKNARHRPNRRAVRAGYALFVTALILLVTGFVLVRLDVFGVRLEVNNPTARSVSYWLHVLTPLIAVWLFILHRLAGKRIKWKTGLAWAGAAGVFAAVMLVLQTADPRAWNMIGPQSGETYFFPSLARTSTGQFIPERVLDNDEYCLECHADIHDSWAHSVHRFSSFNNPPYLFSVQQTRAALMERDGNVQGSRFCAGCHDPVPFFSGAFDDPKFDDPDYDLGSDPTAQAGITCTVCHSIAHVNSVRGNADYTIDEPVHYPFAFSTNPLLRWINRQLVKAKPEFHKATFLKPEVHRSTEYCGACHKVHLPVELNDYKWLRGQNHYDAFWLSGVSGQGISSFYYPPEAEQNCNNCHMPLVAASDKPNFGARVRDDSGQVKTIDHQFPSANAAIPHLVRQHMRDADEAIRNHQEFLEGVMRVDIFGIKEGGRIDGELMAPLRPEVPTLMPGQSYLLQVVIRTVKMGHIFTQGTADSNEVWMDVEMSCGDRVIGRSGGKSDEGEVDPWSHFVNAFVVDREGNRIDRRNAEDIFIALYNNQIPPGAADIVHYLLEVPEDAEGTLTVTVALRYRKFDTLYMRFFQGEDFDGNDLPILLLAEDSVTFPIADSSNAVAQSDAPAPEWMRWNDYGIALLREGDRGELRGAEHAFEQVEALGKPDGPLNLARVYLKEGRVAEDAPVALQRASEFDPPAQEWSVLWFTGLANKQNGKLDEAIENFQQILDGGFSQAAGRGFDFSKDYRVLNELASTYYLRAKQERGPQRRVQRDALLRHAEDLYLRALEYDPENLTAHYGLKQVYTDLGNDEKSLLHAQLHAKYKPDDNARDRAVAQARIKYPAANKAAEAVVIYDLQRQGAYGLAPTEDRTAIHDGDGEKNSEQADDD
jgi:hypothetical protein